MLLLFKLGGKKFVTGHMVISSAVMCVFDVVYIEILLRSERNKIKCYVIVNGNVAKILC